MKFNQLNHIISAFCLASFLAACTSTGPVEKVSSRAIDRPLTLPKGVASWSTVAVIGNVKTPAGNTFIPPIPIPLFWEQSLNDDLTLEWIPLPLALRYQISKTENQMWGVNFGMGLSYGSSEGWVFSPTVGLSNRSKISPDFAIASSVGVSGSFKTGDNKSNGYALNASVGPLVQVADSFALNAAVGIDASKASLGSSFVAPTTTDTRSTLVPLSAGLDYRMSKQWAFNATYSYLGLGSSDWSSNLVFMRLTHYW